MTNVLETLETVAGLEHTRFRVFGYLLRHPHTDVYPFYLAGHLGLPESSVRRALYWLAKRRLAQSRATRYRHYFSLKRGVPGITRFHSLFYEENALHVPASRVHGRYD